MAWGQCEYCGYSECECGMAAMPEWISARKERPEEGRAVLWYDPDSDGWNVFVGKRDGCSVDCGGDLNSPIPERAFWMDLPGLPRVRKARKKPAS